MVVAFDPPDSPYGTGHRGIDIAAALGTQVLAPADGVVTFAGPVGGRLFVTDRSRRRGAQHLVVPLERHGPPWRRGVGRAGRGQPRARATSAAPMPVLHFSVRLDDVYVDPMTYLPMPDPSAWLRLAPV